MGVSDILKKCPKCGGLDYIRTIGGRYCLNCGLDAPDDYKEEGEWK